MVASYPPFKDVSLTQVRGDITLLNSAVPAPRGNDSDLAGCGTERIFWNASKPNAVKITLPDFNGQSNDIIQVYQTILYADVRSRIWISEKLLRKSLGL
jgi:hypothetical protein